MASSHPPRHLANVIRLLLVASALLAIIGCGVLKIEVDVYKGPLSNNEDVQTEQLAAMAIGAKPLLIELRRQLESKVNETLHDKNKDLNDLYDKDRKLVVSSRFLNPRGTYYVNEGGGDGCVVRLFDSRLAGRVNNVLYLYENIRPEYELLSAEEQRLLVALDRVLAALDSLPQAIETMDQNVKKAKASNVWLRATSSSNEKLQKLGNDAKAFVSDQGKSEKGLYPSARLIKFVKEHVGVANGLTKDQIEPIHSAFTPDVASKTERRRWVLDAIKIDEDSDLEKRDKSDLDFDSTTKMFELLSKSDIADAISATLMEVGVKSAAVEESPQNETLQDDLVEAKLAADELSGLIITYAKNFLKRQEAAHDLLVASLELIVCYHKIYTCDNCAADPVIASLVEVVKLLVDYDRLSLLIDTMEEKARPGIFAPSGKDSAGSSLSKSPAEFLAFPRQAEGAKITIGQRKKALGLTLTGDNSVEAAKTYLQLDRQLQPTFIDGLVFSSIGRDDIDALVVNIHTAIEPLKQTRDRITAGGFEGGRLDDGLETMIEEYLKARDKQSNNPANHEENVKYYRDRLHDAMIRFSEKILFIANYQVLLEGNPENETEDEERRRKAEKTISKRYVMMLQAVGNSILTQIDELEHRKDFNDPKRLSRLGLIEASGTITAPPGADEVFVHLVNKVDQAISLFEAQENARNAVNTAAQAQVEQAKQIAAKATKDREAGPFPNETREALKAARDHIDTHRAQIMESAPKANRVGVVNRLTDVLGKLLTSNDINAKTKEHIESVLVYYRDHHPMPSEGIGKKNYAYADDPRHVIDQEIAAWRHRYVESVADTGENSEQSKRLKQAIDAAAEFRQSMIHLRPPSAYLRNSYPATTLQAGGNGFTWENLLLEHGVQQVPLAGLFSYNQDAKIQAEIDKQFWQKINTVRVAGGGLTNYVVTKDDVGNWYVKNYEADPGPIIDGAAGLASLYMTGGFDPADIEAVREGEAPSTTNNTSIGKLRTAHQEQGDVLEQSLRTQTAKLPGAVKDAWAAMEFKFTSEEYTKILEEEAKEINGKAEAAQSTADKTKKAVEKQTIADTMKAEAQEAKKRLEKAEKALEQDSDNSNLKEEADAARRTYGHKEVESNKAREAAVTSIKVAGLPGDANLATLTTKAEETASAAEKAGKDAKAAKEAEEKAKNEGIHGKLDAETLARLNQILDAQTLELPQSSAEVTPTDLIRAIHGWQQRVVEQINTGWDKPYKLTAEYEGETYTGEIKDAREAIKPVSDKAEVLIGSVIASATKQRLEQVKVYQQKLDVVAETVD